jgi:methyltransferase (TIGR00027 family)
MKPDLPSRTAQFVAMGRAMADLGLTHVPEFHDPTARLFLTDKSREQLAKTEKLIRSGASGMRIEYAKVMSDMMALRTSAIDAAVREAVARGAKQLVILGAGYDGRAWRMPELGGVKVFEVDHPATQGAKRKRIPELPPAFGDVSFVSINFEQQQLGEVLARAGHDRSVQTCWIWEGVVMYLTKEAMRATLASVSARSAPSSTLIVNYHSQNRRLIARLIFRLIGEPMISHWTPDEMAAEMRAARFSIREDTGMVEWNARFAHGRASVQRGTYMRIAVADRQA